MADTLSPAMVPVATAQRRPSLLRLLLGQARYATRHSVRTPIAAFFTLIFPLTFLVILCAALDNVAIDQRQVLHLAQYCVTNPGVSWRRSVAAVRHWRVRGVRDRRDNLCHLVAGRQRRPGARSAQTAGRHPAPVVGTPGRADRPAFVVAAATVILLFGVGMSSFNVHLSVFRLPSTILALAVGAAMFTALGLALAMALPSSRTVSAVALGTLLPLAFICDIFLLSPSLPPVLSAIGWSFPLRHFVNAVFEATDAGHRLGSVVGAHRVHGGMGRSRRDCGLAGLHQHCSRPREDRRRTDSGTC
jgi:hypothetical protein